MSRAQNVRDRDGLTVAFVLYEDMTALDVIGPMEVFRFLPGVRVVLVAAAPGRVRTDVPGVDLVATAAFRDLKHPDLVVVPGGPGTAQVLDGELVSWLRVIHAGTRWTTSVCSGSLVLAAAGLLDRVEATSHFSVRDLLSGFGAVPVQRRVVVNRGRRVVTSAGVSAGVDMALTLAADLCDELTAQAIQLVIEYDPAPPYSSGSLSSATTAVIDRAIEIGRPHGAIPAFWEAPARTEANLQPAGRVAP